MHLGCYLVEDNVCPSFAAIKSRCCVFQLPEEKTLAFKARAGEHFMRRALLIAPLIVSKSQKS